MKKHLSPALALLGVSALLGVAQAQTPMNGTPMSGTPMNGTPMNGTPMNGTMNNGSTMATSDADKQFMTELAQGSVYDGATAQLAVQKAQSRSVQRYALKLMDDHNRLNKQLLMQANKRGVTLPLTLSDDDKAKLQNYMDMSSGMDFDMAYLQEAIRINAEDAKKGQSAITASSDKEFRSLINDYVSTEQKHLNEASALLAGLQRNMGMTNGAMMNGGMMNGAMMNNTDTDNGSMMKDKKMKKSDKINADNGMMNTPSTTIAPPPATVQ